MCSPATAQHTTGYGCSDVAEAVGSEREHEGGRDALAHEHEPTVEALAVAPCEHDDRRRLDVIGARPHEQAQARTHEQHRNCHQQDHDHESAQGPAPGSEHWHRSRL